MVNIELLEKELYIRLLAGSQTEYNEPTDPIMSKRFMRYLAHYSHIKMGDTTVMRVQKVKVEQ
jgi:hypothetical protein